VHSKTSLPKTVRADSMRMDRRNTERVASIIQGGRNPILETFGDLSVPLWIFEELTKYGARLLESEWKLSVNYIITQVSKSSFRIVLAKKNEKEEIEDEDEDDEVKLSALVVSVQNYLVCTCSFFVAFGMVCRHVLAVLQHLGTLHTMNSIQVHLRWHKSWYNGMFLMIYYRHHNDGHQGVFLSSPLPEYNHSSFPENQDIQTTPPPDSSSYYSPPPLFSLNSTPYQLLHRRFREVEKHFLSEFSHTQAGAEWVVEKLLEFERDTFRQHAINVQEGVHVGDGKLPTDQPMTKSRSKFRFEANKFQVQGGKKRKRMNTPRNQPSSTPSSSLTDPASVLDTIPRDPGPTTRSQTVTRADTPPLTGLIFA
jgi:hypothetical protein